MNNPSYMELLSETTPGDNYVHPARVGLGTEIDLPPGVEPFFTYLEVFPRGLDPYRISGHYNLDYQGALDDFRKRTDELMLPYVNGR